jgi:hypothetical protein
MTSNVVHHPRLAWDGARAFVAALHSDVIYFWLRARLGEVLGEEYQLALSDSYDRVQFPIRVDAYVVELGIWRARLVDVLNSRPELRTPIADLIRVLRTKLPS